MTDDKMDAVTALDDAVYAAWLQRDQDSLLPSAPAIKRQLYKRGYHLIPIAPVQEGTDWQKALSSRIERLLVPPDPGRSDHLYLEGWKNAIRMIAASLPHDLAAQGVRVVPGWQPIETAPKSTFEKQSSVVKARYLLGFIPDMTTPLTDPLAGVSVIWWEPFLHGGCWCSDAGGEQLQPTMWCEIPDLVFATTEPGSE